MKTIDATGVRRYSPLIPIMKALGEADKGDELVVILDESSAFNDLKEYLAEQNIGFREIYEGEKMLLQFTLPS